MTDQIGTEAWLHEIFARRVASDIFTGHHPQPSPVLVLLGGQPAAGKTRAQRAILAEYATEDLVEITGDDLREYHPDYDQLADESPFAMPGVTAPVSGGLVRLALDHALEHRFSVLLEGTFRDADMVSANARRFADAGYRVEVVAVATPGPVSRLSAEERSLAGGFPEIGRWTPPDAHDTAFHRSGEVVAALEEFSFVSRMRVFSREAPLYDNSRSPDGTWAHPARAAAVFREEQYRRLDPPAALAWLNAYQGVFQKAAARPGYLGAETSRSFQGLQANARAMLDILAQAPAAMLRELWQLHSTRQAALRRRLPDAFPPVGQGSTVGRVPEIVMPDDPDQGREPPARGL